MTTDSFTRRNHRPDWGCRTYGCPERPRWTHTHVLHGGVRVDPVCEPCKQRIEADIRARLAAQSQRRSAVFVDPAMA